jgi:hypothetical protein
VSVSFSPTARSTVAGAGVTFVPVTVMSMVRPAGLELLVDELLVDELELLLEELGVVVAEVDELVVAGSSPALPQAVRPRVRGSARASPAAYVRGARGVIFVTNPSLNSAF